MTTTAWVKTLLLAAMGYCATASAATPVIQLDFTGIANGEEVREFYNGGTDSAGNSGINYGVSFKEGLIGLDSTDPLAEFSGEPTKPSILASYRRSAYINIANGFGTGLAFYYTNGDFEDSVNGTINIYEGENLEGALLGTLTLDKLETGTDDSRPYINWKMAAISFTGVAKSIGIMGTALDLGFDNLTLGALDANIPAVPEPASILQLLFGIGVITALRRRIGKN